VTGLRPRRADPRNPKNAIIGFLLIVATLAFLILAHFAVVTDHGPPRWSAITR
jgi:hypothetical protein